MGSHGIDKNRQEQRESRKASWRWHLAETRKVARKSARRAVQEKREGEEGERSLRGAGCVCTQESVGGQGTPGKLGFFLRAAGSHLSG